MQVVLNLSKVGFLPELVRQLLSLTMISRNVEDLNGTMQVSLGVMVKIKVKSKMSMLLFLIIINTDLRYFFPNIQELTT